MARTCKHPRLAAAAATAAACTSSAVNRVPSLAGTGAEAPSADQRNWVGLLPELLSKVADGLLLSDVAEYIRLRSVCKPWRGATADPSILQPQFFPRNWLMLGDIEEDGEPQRFVNVLTGAALQIHLPTPYEYSHHGSAEGLLVLHHSLTDTVCLLNPLTMEFADLPPTSAIPGRITFGSDDITAAGVVVDEEGAGVRCQPTVVLCVTAGRHSAMFYAKPRDILWAAVDVGCVDDGEGELPAFMGGLAVRGHFYVPTRSGDVLAVQLQPKPRLAYVARQNERWGGFGMRSYLVPSLDVDADDNDGMLLVRSFHDSNLGFDAFDAFGVNVAERRLTQLLDLGNRTIFLPSLTLRSNKFFTVMEEAGMLHENDDVEDYIL